MPESLGRLLEVPFAAPEPGSLGRPLGTPEVGGVARLLRPEKVGEKGGSDFWYWFMPDHSLPSTETGDMAPECSFIYKVS